MNPQMVPVRLHLDREKHLEIDWGDGQKTVYALGYLRRHCPCADCKALREQQQAVSRKLTVLPASAATGQPIRAVRAELVGNYALRIDWSDEHGAGIYSFTYLFDLRDGAERRG